MRPVLTHTLVVLVMITSLGAAQPRKTESKPPAKASHNHAPPRAKRQVPKPYQVGRASWYGKYFHGRKTASGEPYDMFQFTAAHQVLPLGTMVKVTNLRNGLWVIVRVNDRGPVPRSRIIDLSYGAAQILDLRAEGVERVRLDLIQPQQLAKAEALVGGSD
ncbi:MAG: septal ring lytic transglycosylase RlpA family protein [Terriglobales bacterium]